MNALEFAIVRAVYQAEMQLLREVNDRKIQECKETIRIFRPVVDRVEREESSCRSRRT